MILSLEFFRFLFTLVIAIWHMPGQHLIAHGYLAVEFFFLLSGFFIYHSYKNKSLPTVVYTMHRIRRLFLPCALMLMLTVCCLSWHNWGIHNIDNILINALFLQNVFGDTGSIVGPLWYISVLIFGGGILYSFVKLNERLAINLILPCLFLVILTYCMQSGNNIEGISMPPAFYPFFYRGLCGMSLGIMLGYLSVNYSWLLKDYALPLNILSVLSCFMMVIPFFILEASPYALYLYFSFIILGCSLNGSWMNRLLALPVWKTLGKISLDIYIIHMFVIRIFNWFRLWDIKDMWLIMAYLLSLVLLAFCYRFVVRKIEHLLHIRTV